MKTPMRSNYFYRSFFFFILLLAACTTTTETPPEKSLFQEFANLERVDPILPTLQLMKEERYAEASDYLSYFLELEYVKDDFDANTLYKKIQKKREDWQYQGKKALEGCIEGNSDENSGLATASICDVLVIGDIRDLGEQGRKYLEGQEIDKMTVALASLGIGAAGATAITLGTSASAKPAISLLKLSKKADKFPDWLPGYLSNLAANTKNTKSATEFSGFFVDLWNLHQFAGTKATLELLSKSQNIEDFRKLSKFGAQFGNKTYTLLKLGGDEVISLAQRNKDIPKQLYFEASSFGKNGIKVLDKADSQKFQAFINAENTTRRRMTNFEMSLITNGKRTTVLGNDFVKKDYLFNPQFVDGAGNSNIDRMKMGLAPIGKDGNPINLHHMKQQKNGTLVEMSASEHREHSALLHRYSRVSEIDREEFDLLKKPYWKMRAKDFE